MTLTWPLQNIYRRIGGKIKTYMKYVYYAAKLEQLKISKERNIKYTVFMQLTQKLTSNKINYNSTIN